MISLDPSKRPTTLYYPLHVGLSFLNPFILSCITMFPPSTNCRAMFWPSILLHRLICQLILHHRYRVAHFGQVPLEVSILMLVLVLGLKLRATRYQVIRTIDWQGYGRIMRVLNSTLRQKKLRGVRRLEPRECRRVSSPQIPYVLKRAKANA